MCPNLGSPFSASSRVILYEKFTGVGGVFVFTKGHNFHSTLDLSMLYMLYLCVWLRLCVRHTSIFAHLWEDEMATQELLA